jgi:hypothetical protein
MKPAIVIILLFFMTACNERSKSETSTVDATDSLHGVKDVDYSWMNNYIEQHCLAAGGMGNFLILSDSAEKMIRQFEYIYNKDTANSNEPIPALIQNFPIDGPTVRIISDFLKNSNKYDGVRLHFAADPKSNPTAYPKPPYQNKTALYIFPTVYNSANKEHRDTWAYIDPSPATSPYLRTYASVSSAINVFERVYQRRMPDNTTTGNSLSKSVWIDSCVIFFMKAMLDQSQEEVDGYNIKMAAYLGTETRLPRGAENIKLASTVLIVPTSPNAPGDRSNWEIMNRFLSQKDKAFFDALNHGELCPKNCPPTEP